MAAYPTLPWLRDGTTVGREDGLDPVRASNGTLKVRRLFSNEKSDFTIAHWLTDAEKATLVAFYNANKLLDVDLTLPTDGVTYTARFIAAPVYEQQAVNRWVARVRMMQA